MGHPSAQYLRSPFYPDYSHSCEYWIQRACECLSESNWLCPSARPVSILTSDLPHSRNLRSTNHSHRRPLLRRTNHPPPLSSILWVLTPKSSLGVFRVSTRCLLLWPWSLITTYQSWNWSFKASTRPTSQAVWSDQCQPSVPNTEPPRLYPKTPLGLRLIW